MQFNIQLFYYFFFFQEKSVLLIFRFFYLRLATDQFYGHWERNYAIEEFESQVKIKNNMGTVYMSLCIYEGGNRKNQNKYRTELLFMVHKEMGSYAECGDYVSLLLYILVVNMYIWKSLFRRQHKVPCSSHYNLSEIEYLNHWTIIIKDFIWSHLIHIVKHMNILGTNIHW